MSQAGNHQEQVKSMEYVDVPGEEITEQDLSIPYSIDFCKAITDSGFCNLIQFKKIDGSVEVIVFETEVQRPQKIVHDIQNQERIAVYFSNDNQLPRVYALRINFPNVPHINLYREEFPRWLCVYEESFDELRLKWTGSKFLEDIQYWLAQTTIGKLHSDDQPLEFLLLPTFKILVVNLEDLLEIRELKPRPYTISTVTSEDGRETLFMNKAQAVSENMYTACILVGDPQKHGIIKRMPQNLNELSEFTRSANIDLIALLRSTLKQWKEDKSLNGIEHSKLILIIALPKLRHENSPVETYEVIAYMINETMIVIGKEIGIWDMHEGELGYLLKDDDTKNGSTLIGELLNPFYSFTKQMAEGTTGL